MSRLKKILSLCLVGVMGVFGAACGDLAATDGDGSSVSTSTSSQTEPEKEELSSQPIRLLQKDFTPTADQILSRIKSDYLLKNNGYSDSDEVVAILSLDGDALIDSYLENEELASRQSLAEYSASAAGRQRTSAIAVRQDALVRKLVAGGLIKKVDYNYSVVLNAVAVTTTWGDFQTIEKMDGVTANLSETYNLPKEESASTDASAIVNNVDVYETGIFNSGSVADKGITGKKTAVAVLDSGFDCSHRVFKDTLADDQLLLGKNEINRALEGTVQDAAAGVNVPLLNAKKTSPDLSLSDVYYSNKIPFVYDYADKDEDVFPYDSEHGTHVAGIIGGYSEEGYTDKDGNLVTDESGNPIPFKGVAKDTQLVLMKVFPDKSEGAETEDILAAVEDAVALNVDCINMSLGAACGFAREKDGDPLNTVYDKVNDSGVSLITAAGNEYSSGFGGEQGNTNFVTNPDSGTIGSPATYKAGLSVASIDGKKSKYLVANGTTPFFFDESNSISGDENDFFAELYEDMGWSLTDGAKHTLDYVTIPGVGYQVNYSGINVQGKIALVRRGDSTFEDKALQAKVAGAAACIIYNNIDGDILMSMGKTDHIPTISISKDDGTELASRASGTITLCYDQQAGPFMSDFSSWGPLPDLQLKPEITAHGGNITSSVPGGGFDEISGTSMATPNMCGIVVLIRQLLKERYPSYTWQQIAPIANQMLMSTASIILNEEGMPYSPRKQGAGLASLFNVVNTKAYISVDGTDRAKIELKDDPTRKGVYEMNINVVNVSESEAKYELSLIGMTENVSSSDPEHVAESDQLLKGGFTAEKTGGEGTLSGSTVTVPAGQTLKLHITYRLTDEDKNTIDSLFPYGMYVEGFVTLKALGEETSDIDLNVPFLAFYGDWTQAPIFDKTYYEVESEAHDASIDDEDKLKADYYATTPYGSLLYNYMIPLGTYIYDIDTSAYDPIPATPDHIAVSNFEGTIDGIYSVYAGQLRGCKTVTYTVTDKLTGELVWSHVVTNARKSYSPGGTPIPGYEELSFSSYRNGLVNNRQYEFKMVGELDYERDGEPCTGLDTNVRNTFAFDFFMDNEAPIIKQAVYEKEYDRTLKKDRFYVTLTVYDNHYVQSVTPIAFTSNSTYTSLTQNPIPVYCERGQDATLRFEITDLLEDIKYDYVLPSALGFAIDDYAINTNFYLCQLPGTDSAGIKFTSDGSWNGKSKTSVVVPEGSIVDLTQYLATQDPTVDADKDYLKYLTWSVDNPRVARVEEGQLYGLRANGRTTVTVTLTDPYYGDMSASISVYVDPPVASTASESSAAAVSPVSKNDVDDVGSATLRSVRFSYFETVYSHASSGTTNELGNIGARVYLAAHRGGISCYPGESFRLYYDLDPWYVADRYTVEFRSTNSNIATVAQDGTVKALAKGRTTIYMVVKDASGKEANQRATLSVTVNSEFIIENRVLTAYKGTGGKVVIPDDEGILYIGPFAFCLYTLNLDYDQPLPEDDYDANKDPSTNRTVTEVVIPDGVTEIQKYAFYNCTGLQKVTLPDSGSVRFIREYAFYQDGELTDINLEHIEAVGAHAFEGCAKLGVDGENGKTLDLGEAYSLAERAFMGCTSLAYLDLHTLRNVGEEAFRDCTALASVNIEGVHLSESMFEGTGLTSVTIPSTVSVPAFAFASCEHLGSVTFSGSVELIDTRAFANCKALEEITLPNSTFTLGEGAFYGCEALNKVIFAQNTVLTDALAIALAETQVTSFEVTSGNSHYQVSADNKYLLDNAGTKIVLTALAALDTDITISSPYTAIGSGAFSGADIETITFTGNISIGEQAFVNCSALTTVTFAEGSDVTIGTNAFVNCPELATVEHLEAASVIGDYAFAYRTAAEGTNKLQSVSIGENAVCGEGAFFRSGLKEVTIGKGAKFGLGAFSSCRSLTTVNMPAEGGVTFGVSAFANDVQLQTIDLKLVEEITREMFYNCTSLVNADLSAAKTIGTYAFADCGALLGVTLGDQLTSIGEGAFARYSENGSAPQIMTIELPASLEKLGDGAFLGCAGLTNITIPEHVAEIPMLAFSYCTALVTVNLPSGLKTIGDGAFAGCIALSKIGLQNVETIGDEAFTSCLALATVDLTSAKSIGFGAFAETIVTGDLSAPQLTTLGDYAFQKSGDTLDYPTVHSFTAPKLESIGEGAFQSNFDLASFTVPATLKSVGSFAFLGCSSLTNFTDAEGNADAKINDNITLIGGVMYTALGDGKLELKSVPAGKNISTLEVKEGTVRIDYYAGSANPFVTKIVLPDSLKVIANYAFFGYTGLRTVEFKSSVAPLLESEITDEELSQSDPGFELLHNVFDLTGATYGYFNFISMVGKRPAIAMILPANEDLSGYDGIIYTAYFGSVEAAQRSDYVAMEKNLRTFLEYAEEIGHIEKLTMAHEELIDNAVTALNSVKQDATDYGYTAEEWNGLVTMVTDYKAQLSRLKIANAKKAVRDVQALIDALPESYDGSASHDSLLENVRAAIATLTLDERSLLIQDKYNKLTAEYDAAHAGSEDPGPDNPDNPDNPNDPDNPDNPTNPNNPNNPNPSGPSGSGNGGEEEGCGSMLSGGAIAVGLIAAALGIVLCVFLPRKRRTK